MRTARRLAAALGATALVTVAGPAWAAGPYTVSAGGSSDGTSAFSGTAGAITFTSPNTSVNCSGGTAGGTVNLGSNADGSAIASIDSATFSGCSGPFGLSLNITQTQAWTLNATGAPDGGVTAGSITDVAADVTSTGFIPCSFSVSGSVDGSFDENTQTLAVAPAGTGGLTISDVSGCVGFVSNGQVAQMTGSYTISADGGALSITSP